MFHRASVTRILIPQKNLGRSSRFPGFLATGCPPLKGPSLWVILLAKEALIEPGGWWPMDQTRMTWVIKKMTMRMMHQIHPYPSYPAWRPAFPKLESIAMISAVNGKSRTQIFFTRRYSTQTTDLLNYFAKKLHQMMSMFVHVGIFSPIKNRGAHAWRLLVTIGWGWRDLTRKL